MPHNASQRITILRAGDNFAELAVRECYQTLTKCVTLTNCHYHSCGGTFPFLEETPTIHCLNERDWASSCSRSRRSSPFAETAVSSRAFLFYFKFCLSRTSVQLQTCFGVFGVFHACCALMSLCDSLSVYLSVNVCMFLDACVPQACVAVACHGSSLPLRESLTYLIIVAGTQTALSECQWGVCC